MRLVLFREQPMAIKPKGNKTQMKKTHQTKRGGVAASIKRSLKKLARNALLRRWLLIAVVKIVSWLAKRLLSDDDNPTLSS